MSDNTPVKEPQGEGLVVLDPPVINKPKKVFTRADVRKTVDINVVFPRLYPDYEPFGFKFRLKLGNEAEDRRQDYLSLAPTDRVVKQSEQALDEVCDLLVAIPTGFADMQDTGQGPGATFRSYVETATDPAARAMLDMIVEAADSAYWGATAPREFRP